jgi:hypothetical protein
MPVEVVAYIAVLGVFLGFLVLVMGLFSSISEALASRRKLKR